jgi:integrase
MEPKLTWIKTKFQGVFYIESQTKIFKKKPDRCFYITYKTHGRKITEKVGWLSEGYDEKTAAGLRGDRVQDLRHGKDIPYKKTLSPLFKDVAARYMKWAMENKTRAGKDDRNRYENHLTRFDQKRLDEISAFDLEKLKSDLLKEGLAPATARHVLVLFRQIWNKANTWGLWEGPNPIRGVKLPVPQNARERFLSHQEADTLLKALSEVSGTVADMALVSLQTGMRAGEIFDLRGADIDFENGLITIRDPKNKQARKAYLTPTLSAMLKARLPEDPQDYIFHDRIHGGRINIVSQTFRKTVIALGFNKGITDPRQRVTFHTLRHTFGSWLAIQGTPVLTISQLMGHKTLAMTQRYSHLSPDHKKEAALNLERVFNQKINGNVVELK